MMAFHQYPELVTIVVAVCLWCKRTVRGSPGRDERELLGCLVPGPLGPLVWPIRFMEQGIPFALDPQPKLALKKLLGSKATLNERGRSISKTFQNIQKKRGASFQAKQQMLRDLLLLASSNK